MVLQTPVRPSLDALLARLTDSAPVPGFTVVCAWCTPKAELDRLNHERPGQISHGLCPACAAALEQEIG